MEESLSEGLQNILKELPAAFDAANIRTLALLEIVGVDGRISALDRFILERATAVLTQTGLYRIVERERIGKVLGEIKHNLSDVIDQKTAVEAGKLMGADALLAGTRFDHVDELEVTFRIIASRTGQVVWSTSLRVAKDSRARTLFAQEISPRTPGARSPLQLSMFIIARRDREMWVVQDRDVLQSGDKFQIHVQTNANCYFYVVLVEHGGRVQVLFPGREPSDGDKFQSGRLRALPRKDYWYYLDNRPGVETIYGLASYEPLDLKTLEAQLKEGATSAEARISDAIGPEASISQEIILHQRASPMTRRGRPDRSPMEGVLYRGQSIRLRGYGGIVQGPTATLELPDAGKIQAVGQIVHGYTTAVHAITYVHR